MYGNTGDVSDREGLYFDQLRSITEVQLVTLSRIDGCRIKPEDRQFEY